MRTLCTLFALVFSLQYALHGQTSYPLGPGSQVQAGVPRGTVTHSTLAPGRFYPGTPHSYAVYLPANYNKARPLPFMIFLDGSGFLADTVRTPVVLDNLIAQHALPPMIAIFLDPGILPTVRTNTQNRFERVFEYDSLSSRFSSFLLQELIPEVDRSYPLSTDPDDRALAGVSTGAVGAFMAAWNRPDQFHRVLSFIGTYVAMKGADSLPALIRKTEPKPLRIFLQDGTADHIVPAEPWGTFFAGSWPINNRVMYEALEYSGYDARLEMGTEGHNMKQGAAILPDALRWLWRDYPAPVTVHEPEAMHQPGWDPRGKVESIVSLSKQWHALGTTYGPITGLTGSRDGDVFFSDPSAHRLYRVSPAGEVSVFRQGIDAGVLGIGPENRLHVYLPHTREVVTISPGGEQHTLAHAVDVSGMVVAADGTVYYSDSAQRTLRTIRGSGAPATVYTGGEIAQPGALAFSPDLSMLIATDAGSRFSWSFQVQPDGSLRYGEPFYRLEMPESGSASGITGVAEDTIGQVYFATSEGIEMCEANGRLAAILNPPVPGALSGLVFSDDWLYVTEGGRLYRRKVLVRGAHIWAPEQPPTPPL